MLKFLQLICFYVLTAMPCHVSWWEKSHIPLFQFKVKKRRRNRKIWKRMWNVILEQVYSEKLFKKMQRRKFFMQNHHHWNANRYFVAISTWILWLHNRHTHHRHWRNWWSWTYDIEKVKTLYFMLVLFLFCVLLLFCCSFRFYFVLFCSLATIPFWFYIFQCQQRFVLDLSWRVEFR